MCEKQRTLTGTVVEKYTGKRFPNTTVRLASKVDEGQLPASIAHANTDADGHFSISFEDSEDWKPGEYVAVAFHPEALLDPSRLITLDEKKGWPSNPITLEIVNDSKYSQEWGWTFLVILIAFLGSLSYYYYDLHEDNHLERIAPSAPVVALLTLGQKQLVAFNKAPTDPDVFSALNGTLVDIKTLLDKTPSETTHSFGPAKVSALKLLLESLEKTILQGDGLAAWFTFNVLNESAYETKAEYFWTENPKRYLEVLFWAFAATLIRLILNTGTYLLEKSFYLRSIGHHLSLIATVPILALLVTFVISWISIDFTMGGVVIELDKTDVTISIVVAALIGMAPWGARDFLGGLADDLWNKLRGKPKPDTQPCK